MIVRPSVDGLCSDGAEETRLAKIVSPVDSVGIGCDANKIVEKCSQRTLLELTLVYDTALESRQSVATGLGLDNKI